MRRRFIVTIIGKAGSGKTDLTRALLPACPRPVLIIDTMNEFADGLQFDSSAQLARYIINERPNLSGIYTLNCTSDEDAELFFRLAAVSKAEATIVVDEASKFCTPNKIDEHLNASIQYGRHWRQNLVFNARRPAEINRNLTAQSDVLISFRQTEPRDVNTLKTTYSDAEYVPDLEDHEFMAFGNLDAVPFLDELRTRKTGRGTPALVNGRSNP